MAYLFWSSSCAWLRCTKAGRSPSRCCSSSRWGWSVRSFSWTLRGLTNDVYLQIGLLTTMGLASKNAILMIEFAEQAERKGARVIDAALEAARIRLRPILMTSFAFIFGVLPLAISTGAGREQPDRDRHRGDRRDADRDNLRGVLHPLLLRDGPPRHPRWHREAARPSDRISPSGRGSAPRPADAARRRAGAGVMTTRHIASLIMGTVLRRLHARAEVRTACTSHPAVLAGRRCVSAPVGGDAATPVTYRDVFTDSRLQAIIDQALANNRDLRIAAANIAATRAQYRIQRADLLPEIDASGRYTYSHRGSGAATTATSSTGGAPTTGSGTNTGTTGGTGTNDRHRQHGRYERHRGDQRQRRVVGLFGQRVFGRSGHDPAFELDLFGRIRSLTGAALDRYFATEAAARATRLTLVGDIATRLDHLCRRQEPVEGGGGHCTQRPKRASALPTPGWSVESRRGPTFARRNKSYSRPTPISRSNAPRWHRTSTRSSCWSVRRSIPRCCRFRSMPHCRRSRRCPRDSIAASCCVGPM